MFKSAERKRSHGFTLAEVLIVVAIIGILLAVAIPNVISYYRSLKLTELDDSAKTIFMAAQSRLTAMTSAGQDLYALSTVEVNEKPDPGVGTGRFLAVTSEQADSLASIVPGGSIESQLHDNHYVVEIDAKTGAVYAVWYWEKEDFAYTNDAYVNVPSDKGERLKKGAMVGYYGGSEINRPDLGQMPIPQLTVINAEELRLEIRIPDLKLDSGSGFDETYIRVSVLVNGKTIIDSKQLGDVKDTSLQKNYVGKVILDTLKSGYTQEPQPDAAGSGWNFGWVAGAKFEDWVKDNDIVAVPGDDINVTVVVSYLGTVKINGKDTSLVSQSATVHTNSLFAGVEEDSVTGEPVTAKIAYGRHLQNLDTSTSGVITTVTAAEQTRSIDFNDNTSVTDVYSWADTYGSMFKPIENTSLTSYNGHEYEIRNLNIKNPYTDPKDKEFAYLGLFGLLTKTNLDDTIKFENTILVNTESEEGFVVGALVGGLLANGNIDNCHVYLDEIGADGKLRDPNPRLKGSSVGGLVGMAFEDLTITNCSAATVISGTGNVGGLVSGVIGVCEIYKSYAACNITGALVGGLVGNGPGGVTIQNSYAAGTADVIDADVGRKVAGLVNWSTNTDGAIEPEVTNSYAAVRYGKSVTDALASGSLKDFFGACEITPDMTASSKVSDLYYVKQAGITYKGDSGVALSVSEFKDLVGKSPFNNSDYWYVPGGATVNPRGLTTPYKVLDSWLADPYPYPMLASSITAVGGTDKLPMPHYGDWLENSYATSFYWEKEGTEYKFYLVLSDGATKYVADGLCPDHHLTANMGQDIDAWGYGLIGIDAAAVDAAGLRSFIETNADVESALETFLGIGVTSPDPIPWEGSAPGADTLKGITDLLSDASNVILLKGASENKFSAIETGAGWLELNLGFAAAIDVTENTGTMPSAATNMGKTGIPYQIRTVRQLDNIPNSDSKFYEQTHDLYGKDYDADTSNSTSDVYSGPTGFSGNYNGGSYRILELDIDSGLFTSLSGADLHDIILYSPTGEAKNTSTSGNVGGLAGSIQYSGKINNCVVAGYKLSVSSNGSHIGGLIGDIINTSTKLEVTNCAAVNTLSGPTAGGLVGYVTQGTVDISGSYAGGTVESNGYVGGIVGYVGSGYGIEVDYSDVYSYAKITNGFFVYGIGPQGNGSYNNCRYWTGGNRTGRAASDAATYGVTGVSLAQLESGVTAKAQHTYKPGANLTAGLEDLNNRTPNDPYPYPAVVTVPVSAYEPTSSSTATVPVHYGEWPVIEASATYVEIYPTTVANRYGVYGYLSDHAGTPLVNTLLDPTTVTTGTLAYAEDDCYGLLVPDGEPCPGVIPVNGGNLVPVEDSSGYVKYDNIYPASPAPGDQVYDFYRYRFEPDSTAASTNYYHSIKLNKQEFWVNLDYGCEVVKAPAGVTVTTAEPQSKPGAAGFVSGTTPDPDEYDNKVVIRTARQLANMAAATGSTCNATKPAQLRKYEQLLNIDYSKYTGADLKVGSSGQPQAPAALTQKKDSATNKVTDTGSYDGHSHTISNLFIKSNSDKVGLFGELGTANQTGFDGTIQNITLVDVTVDGGGHDQVGALAGNVTNSTPIKNCGVYVSDANSKYSSCTVTGNQYVGGLFGQLGSSTQVSDCYAAVKVEGNDCVGGFAGRINGSSKLSNCYSGGHTEDGEYKDDSINVTAETGSAGGFVGELINYKTDEGVTKHNKYTLDGVLYSTCSVAGIDGETGLFAGHIDDYKDLSSVTHAGEQTIVDAFSGSAVTNYGLGTAFKKAGTGYTQTTPREESYLTTPTVTAKGSGFKTHPYDLPTLEGKDYPYQTNLNEHYGDWVMPKFQVSGYIYWELEGGAYHYSVTAWDREKGAATWDELSIGSTLCNEYDTKGISNYGYGWFYAGDFDGSGPTMTDASGGTEDTSAKGALESSLNTALETALPGVDLGTVTVTAYSYNGTNASGTTQTWTIRHGTETLRTATLNPDFADTINRDATTPYKVRTIRQLQNINHTAYLAQSFTQGHDLDGDGFTYTPIGNGTGDFTGRYDGKGYRIRNLNISVTGEDACAGLFGKASGSANFERIIMWGNDNTISASDSSGTLIKNSRARVGGIVAEIPSGSVTISNCVVTGYRLEVSATGNIFCTSENVYVGGIVANLNGTVENCEAVVNITNNSGSAYIGGLVGEIGSGSVTNSYAGGSVTTSDTTCVGGLVGKAASDNQITNSFSYVTGAHYAIDGNGRTHNSCAYFGDTFANNRDNDAQQCASVTALTNWLISNATFHYAEYVYDGSGEVSGATFNGAVVEVPGPDGDPVYVHYGDLPA